MSEVPVKEILMFAATFGGFMIIITLSCFVIFLISQLWKKLWDKWEGGEQ